MDIYTLQKLVEKASQFPVPIDTTNIRRNPNYITPSEEEIKADANTTWFHGWEGEKNGMYGKTLSDKHKAAVGKSAKERFTGVPKWYKVKNAVMHGSDNPRARKVYAEGKIYDTVSECSKAYGFNHNAIRYRCKSDKWKQFRFVD